MRHWPKILAHEPIFLNVSGFGGAYKYVYQESVLAHGLTMKIPTSTAMQRTIQWESLSTLEIPPRAAPATQDSRGSTASTASSNPPESHQVLRLPRETATASTASSTLERVTKCCACHATQPRHQRRQQRQRRQRRQAAFQRQPRRQRRQRRQAAPRESPHQRSDFRSPNLKDSCRSQLLDVAW